MRFEVPQFIEIEDKIIGPLTWKQFVYLAGGAGVLIILKIALPFIFFVIIGNPFAVLAATLAFNRINNRPFSIFLESFLNYMRKTKLYLWRKETPQTIIEKTAVTEESPSPSLNFNQKQSINSLSRKLEHHIQN